jgi:hypothetical protein
MLHLASFLDQTVVFGEQTVGLVAERLPLLRAGSHIFELSSDRAQFSNDRVCIPLYPHWEPLDPRDARRLPSIPGGHDWELRVGLLRPGSASP